VDAEKAKVPAAHEHRAHHAPGHARQQVHGPLLQGEPARVPRQHHIVDGGGGILTGAPLPQHTRDFLVAGCRVLSVGASRKTCHHRNENQEADQ
jgi:hypothetical protein